MTIAGLEYLHNGTALVRKGRGLLPLSARPSIYGTHEPTELEAGFLPPGDSMTNWNSPTTTVTMLDGQTPITEADIYGDVFPPAFQSQDMFFNNCRFHGGTHLPTGNTGVINCASGARSGPGRMIFTDCTIAPDNPQDGRDGIRGVKWEAYRCDVSHVVDGFGIFPNLGGGQSPVCDVVAMGNVIHDLVYQSPETVGTHSDNQTHNDCVQIQGGTNIHLKGNYFEASVGLIIGTPPTATLPRVTARGPGSGYANNGVIAQDNVGAPLDNTVIIEDNWLTMGIQHADLQPSAVLIWRNNHHHVDTWNRHIFAHPGSVITGLNTNIWADGVNVGQILTTANGGIQTS